MNAPSPRTCSHGAGFHMKHNTHVVFFFAGATETAKTLENRFLLIRQPSLYELAEPSTRECGDVTADSVLYTLDFSVESPCLSRRTNTNNSGRLPSCVRAHDSDAFVKASPSNADLMRHHFMCGRAVFVYAQSAPTIRHDTADCWAGTQCKDTTERLHPFLVAPV